MTRIGPIGEAMVEMAPCKADGTYQMGFTGDLCRRHIQLTF